MLGVGNLLESGVELCLVYGYIFWECLWIYLLEFEFRLRKFIVVVYDYGRGKVKCFCFDENGNIFIGKNLIFCFIVRVF